MLREHFAEIVGTTPPRLSTRILARRDAKIETLVAFSFLFSDNQLAKNFFSSAFNSSGRCSISQCPVSLNMIDVTLVATIFA